MNPDATSGQWPADAVERRPLDSLLPYARNARTHSDLQVRQIAASINEWGWTIPVLIDETGMLIAGHGRILAARLLDLKDVPCMVARGWSDDKKRAYVIADNKLAENAGWDEELLRTELSELLDVGFDLGLTGFNLEDLDGLLAIAGDGERALEELAQPNGGDRKVPMLTFGKRKVPLTEAELQWLEESLDAHVEQFGLASGFVEQTLNVRA